MSSDVRETQVAGDATDTVGPTSNGSWCTVPSMSPRQANCTVTRGEPSITLSLTAGAGKADAGGLMQGGLDAGIADRRFVSTSSHALGRGVAIHRRDCQQSTFREHTHLKYPKGAHTNAAQWTRQTTPAEWTYGGHKCKFVRMREVACTLRCPRYTGQCEEWTMVGGSHVRGPCCAIVTCPLSYCSQVMCRIKAWTYGM